MIDISKAMRNLIAGWVKEELKKDSRRVFSKKTALWWTIPEGYDELAIRDGNNKIIEVLRLPKETK